MISPTTREAILEALELFDLELRDTQEWAEWDQGPPHKFAIAHEGRRYPVKQIISIATDTPTSAFSGGDEANRYVGNLGFEIITLRPDAPPNVWWVNQGESYRQERDGGYLWAPLRNKAGRPQVHWETMAEVRPGDIIVHYVDGSVRALSRATSAGHPAHRPTELSEDSWELEGRLVEAEYAVLTEPIPRTSFAEQLRALQIPAGPIASNATVKMGYLWRFSLAGLRILRAASPAATWPVWAESILGNSGGRAWIFQANPSIWDLDGALASLDEFNWSVKQYRHEIHAGDRVYLWESGKDAGILALATILTEPAVLPDDHPEYRKGASSLDEPQPRVRLHIDRVLERRIARQQLLEHPILKGMSIVRFSQGTNFALTDPEAQALRELCAAHASPTVVKIAPGEGGRYWGDCLANGYICVGWDEVGDLAEYGSKAEFRASFGEQFPYGTTAKASAKANELWTLRELAPGDKVVANRGASEVLAVGTVLEPAYSWHPERDEYKHTVRVSWDTTVAKRIPEQPSWRTTTVAKVPPDLYRLIMGEALPGDATIEEVGVRVRPYDALLRSLRDQDLHFPSEVVSNYLLALQTKRFVILSGISGTGKTQLARAVAGHFRAMAKVNRIVPAEDGKFPMRISDFVVKPANRKLNLPAEFVATVALPVAAELRERRITVSYPEGAEEVTVYREPERNVTSLFMRGDFMRWVKSRLTPGDTIFVEALSDASATTGLRFTLPQTSVQDTPLENRLVTAVRPDWTDNRGLLGYYNPLTHRYMPTPALRLLLEAAAEERRAREEGRTPAPFFLILDEMNLARVEHYFSDFLSCLESGEPLELHDDPLVEEGEDEDGPAVPRRLPIPGNLFITGTVNVDETTYMFSPKVLDRAFTIELDEVDLRGYGGRGAPLQDSPHSPLLLRNFPGLLPPGKPSAGDWSAFGALLDGELRQCVVELHELLSIEHRHFGYRVANEIARFVSLAADQAGAEPDTLRIALDLAILQKVLPKFHGTQQELGEILARLFDFAIAGEQRDLERPADQVGLDWELRGGDLAHAADGSGDVPYLPRTAAKLWSMLRRLRQQGFTAFIE